MKTKTFLFIATLLLSQMADAQIMFEKRYGGLENETGNSVLQTNDGGYIVTGSTESYGTGGRDIYLIKTNEYGNAIWTKTFGGSGDDQATCIQKTNNNGYIIVGRTSSFGSGSIDVFCIKTDQNGDTLWTRTYGGTESDDGSGIIQTNDNCYLIVGATSSLGAGLSNVYCIKIDVNGDTLWTKTYNKKNSNYGASVIQTVDNGYLIVGTTSNLGVPNSKDGYIIKINSVGDTLWTNTITGIGDDWAFTALELSDGNYILSGATNSFGSGGYDIYLTRLDNIGNVIWMKTYGGVEDDWGGIFQKTDDNGYVILGNTYSYGLGIADIYLIKTNEYGDTLWTKTFGGTGDDWGSCVKQTTDNGFIISGYTNSFGNAYDVYLIKTNASGVVGFQQIISPNTKCNVFPNPNHGIFSIILDKQNNSNVLIQIFDINGKKVYSKTGFNQVNTEFIEMNDLPEGLYFVYLSNESFNITKKIVIIK